MSYTKKALGPLKLRCLGQERRRELKRTWSEGGGPLVSPTIDQRPCVLHLSIINVLAPEPWKRHDGHYGLQELPAIAEVHPGPRLCIFVFSRVDYWSVQA